MCISAAGPSAQPDNGSIVHTGQATYYNATGAGNCGFDATPNDLMVCAMNDTEYDTASVCGAAIRITGPKGEVTVRIVDRCPECPRGNVDLSKQAFAKIADTIQGRVAITWSYVETAVTGPVQYRIVTGSNQWWIGILVLNHRNPVTKLEAMKNNAWKILPRMEWNVFVDSTGLGVGPYSFRVTDLYGEQLIDANIKLVPDSIQNGVANFTSHSAVIYAVNAHSMHRGTARPLLVSAAGNCRVHLPDGLTAGMKQVYNSRGQLVGVFSSGAAARLPGQGIFIVQ
jgi:expansin (peptidoglycan-binding protein)